MSDTKSTLKPGMAAATPSPTAGNNELTADPVASTVSESQGSESNQTSATSRPSKRAESADPQIEVSSLTVAPSTQKSGEHPAVNSSYQESEAIGHTSDTESISTASLTKTHPAIPDISAFQDTIEVINGTTCNGPCMDPPFEMKTFGPSGPRMYFCLDCVLQRNWGELLVHVLLGGTSVSAAAD
ncbi:uncharacterized protein BP01DRAFT_122224 [Aspergillus saccharolyticus JOP 1030-1]|uniref:Uncharacterized protein n=1 Tax=Aspergillus saccharolyticus JOP 1030-1 TaxID=1450539 RepID=A0A318Z995_9EURO|nr:hypothetical protein BP01DRAFT_122224 [Aspergillus saccharolyticus JOP 1030-1]PYH42977.1 hypothetical protein BP01DRAFT_122224 [Aspergillus saccharolyticus JOP 1030-1]